MTPDARWLLAAALAVSAAIWVTLCWERRPSASHMISSLSLMRTDDPPPIDADGAVDLEGRWIGHGLVVKHHPHAGRSDLFAHLDAEGEWARSAGSEDSSIARAGP